MLPISPLNTIWCHSLFLIQHQVTSSRILDQDHRRVWEPRKVSPWRPSWRPRRSWTSPGAPVWPPSRCLGSRWCGPGGLSWSGRPKQQKVTCGQIRHQLNVRSLTHMRQVGWHFLNRNAFFSKFMLICYFVEICYTDVNDNNIFVILLCAGKSKVI